MRVLVLNASPKGEQSHTMAITRAFLSGFPEGTQTELLELRRLNIRPCLRFEKALDIDDCRLGGFLQQGD